MVLDEGLKLLSKEEALNLAKEAEKDLVQVGTSDDIAVCKILDYKKYLYDKKKKEKAVNKPKQEIKEVKLGYATAEHDLKIKAKTAERLLKEGNKVKVTILYKGRTVQFIGHSKEKLYRFDALIDISHNIDVEPKIDGNKAIMILSPLKS